MYFSLLFSFSDITKKHQKHGHTFWYFVLICPVFDPLLPGPDVPDPDGADGDDHQDREQEDAHQDGDDHVGRVS